MTALSAVPEAPLRPVPWSRLAWVAWRRYRGTLVATVGVLVALGAFLLVDGLRMRTAYDSYLSCTPTRSLSCQFAWETFRDGYAQPGLVQVVLMFVPGVVGVFAGAPVLARELETGTYRYTWTQTVGRTRAAVAAVVPGAWGVAVIVAAFGILVAWHDQPLADSGVLPRLRSLVFPASGVAGAGWALAGFALGVLAGMIWRRVLPALASGLIAWFGLAFLTATVLRPRYRSPLTTTSFELAPADVPLDQWWTKGGVRVTDADLNSALQAAGLPTLDSGTATAHPGTAAGIDPVQYLVQHDYSQVTSYQPGGWYWGFQWLEFGWLTVLALLLLAGALRLLARRTA